MLPFLYGFITALLLCSILAFLYYRRALCRVRAIEQHITDYQQATKTVKAACDKAFANQ
jgi:hypothetical protein